ncbi:caspase family protein [Cryptosporangium sp. NPDC051539]|uniref:wHTH domain-containing protein n=1 Tax=Cryptosporangium sp. NPDC051539 TaxID=3363962 RepID=UPI0037999C90
MTEGHAARAYRAYLFGVAEYDDDSFAPLPFVTDDLAALGPALTDVGYDVRIHDEPRADLGRMRREIERFFSGAQPGQRLLLVLSGHGIRSRGRDYLVPSSASSEAWDLPQECVSLDFVGNAISRSRCGDVVVVVDACRRDVDPPVKAKRIGGHLAAVARPGHPTTTYVHACAPGGLAHVETSAGGPRSAFTRAMTDVLRSSDRPARLGDFFDEVQRMIDGGEVSGGHRSQKIEVDGPARPVLLFDPASGPAVSDEHPWIIEVRDHPVWWQLPETAGVRSGVRDVLVALTRTWASSFERDLRTLGGDDWLDRNLAPRTARQVGRLVDRVVRSARRMDDDDSDEVPTITAAEAALLAGFPFLQQAHWAARAVARRAALDVLDDRAAVGHAAFRDFADTHPRLIRRLDRLTAGPDRDGLRWWLLHRWITRDLSAYRPDPPPHPDPDAGPLGPLVAGAFDGETVERLLAAHRLGPRELTAGYTEPAWPAHVPGPADVRRTLVTVLLVAAHRFAIDPLSLPDVVVDHLGIPDPVALDEVRDTLRGTTWVRRSRVQVLSASCTHPAVDRALQHHVAQTAALLSSVNLAYAGSPLGELPAGAVADRVRAGTDATGRPRYDAKGFRFRLAADRIQELLMGEQLYGDRTLALRELYQNSLDACRFRAARTQFLRRTRSAEISWAGEISFTQGVDEKGEFVRCHDTGVGMSEMELADAFSYAGARFTELPTFAEEKAEWYRHGIPFAANSRFGIGVLSYFMLADEFTVETCQYRRDGTFGRRLRVLISGPDSIARIHDEGPGTESFTTVTLYLREDGPRISCVETLRRLLWIAEFSTRAGSASEALTWKPGQLSDSAPVGTESPGSRDVGRRITRVVPGHTADLWWCDGPGAVLADGLWVSAGTYGTVVNLRAGNAPELTVDRTRLLRTDTELIGRIVRQGIDALLAAPDPLVTPEWLGALVQHDQRIADAVARAAIERPLRPWRINGVECDIRVTGCFPPDLSLLVTGEAPRYELSSRKGHEPSLSQQFKLSEQTGSWRLLAWAAAGLVPPLRALPAPAVPAPALPSDAFLLDAWMPDVAPRYLRSHVLDVAFRCDRAPADVVTRLTELGYPIGSGRWPSAPLSASDRKLLPNPRPAQYDRAAGGDEDDVLIVPWHYVLDAAVRQDSAPQDIVERYAALGFRTARGPRIEAPLSADDRCLIGRGLGDEWDAFDDGTFTGALDAREPVPNGHVLAVSIRVGRSPGELATRLTELGYHQTVAGPWPDTTLTEADLPLLRGSHYGGYAYERGGRTAALEVHAVAVSLGREPADVFTRYAELGYDVEPDRSPGAPLTEFDLSLAGPDFGGTEPWRSLTDPMPLSLLSRMAVQHGLTLGEIAARCRRLGYRLARPIPFEGPLTGNDLALTSRYPASPNDGSGELLDRDDPVPVAHVLIAASVLGWSPARAAARLTELGLRVAPIAWAGLTLTPDDHALLGNEPPEYGHRLSGYRPMSVAQVHSLADGLRWSPAQVAARCTRLGFTLWDGHWPAEVLTRIDRVLANRHYQTDSGDDDTVPAGEIASAAAGLRRSAADVAARYAELGYRVAAGPWPDTTFNESDVSPNQVRNDNDGYDDRTRYTDDGWPGYDEEIRSGQILLVAARTKRAPADLAARYAELGYATAPGPWPGEPLTDDDTGLVGPGRTGSWLDLERPLTFLDLLHALTTRSELGRIAARYAELGYTLPTGLTIAG